MGLFRSNNYKASPLLKMQVMARYPGLKASEMEALTQLVTTDAKEAASYIKGMMSESCYIGFKEKVRSVDPKAAKYLDDID